MQVDSERLKKFLVDAEVLAAADFDVAAEESQKSGMPVGDVLVAKGFLDREKLVKFQAYLLGVPFVNIEKEAIAPEILSLIPEPIARQHNIVAFRKNGNNLEVVMLDPEDLQIIDFLKKADPQLAILPRLTTPEGLKNALRQYQNKLDGEFKVLAEGLSHQADVTKAATELPVIEIIDKLLNYAILQRASDVHIEPLEKEMVVRLRVDGILTDAMTLPISAALGITARIKVLSNLKLDEHRLPQDGRFKIETPDYKYSVRVSVLPVFTGEKIVMRLLAENVKGQALEGLGIQGQVLELLKTNIKRPTGMILITGPTGSGKTTTLYSMMEILNTPAVNISTIEDPIEYRMPRINQTQVNAPIGLTFAAGLRSLMRQDPNVIMVGEIRDGETASLAVNAALTGHLVLSTLHTTDAAGAVPRLIDMGVEPFLIASTVNVIIAQRLVRTFAGEKEKYFLTQEALDNLAKYCDLVRILQLLQEEKLAKPKETFLQVPFYRPKSSKVSKTGYKGRLGIYEVLPVTPAIKELVGGRAAARDIAQQAIKDGMRTMAEDGFVKAAQGLTSLEEVLRVIVE